MLGRFRSGGGAESRARACSRPVPRRPAGRASPPMGRSRARRCADPPVSVGGGPSDGGPAGNLLKRGAGDGGAQAGGASETRAAAS